MNLRRSSFALLAVLAALVSGAAALGSLPSGEPTVGLARLDASASPLTVVRGIATFDAAPTAAQVAALKAAGLTVQPLKHLPLALVRGTVQSMDAAVRGGTANDVYPDDPIQYFDQASADAMGAAATRAAGFTGKGVTVAVVDSGCDASHPDLADHVVHNVKLYSPEYANIPPDSSTTIVVPVELGPYQNSDLGSGHGTHVAGIIAADGHTAPEHIGVAPDANLVCYSIGEVLFTTAVVTAYDHLLDQPQLWGVKVINNSWGNSFQQFDPRSPVAVATKAVADLGVSVVFAAGNSGQSNAEMSLNPFSEAPWVTSVASEDVQHARSDFSSNGLLYDNSQGVTIGAGGHTVFSGNRIGIYHPDVTAPGSDISSTCDTAGTAVGPCPPGENTVASGTSMASPHAAGAAAVLLQANPALTPDQVRSALQSTAAPVTDTVGGAQLGFWQVGYGHIALGAAVDLVRKAGYAKQISAAQAAADKRVLGSIGYTVPKSDFWTWDAPRVAVAGSDSRSFSTNVPSTTTHL
jgi:serine protease AprX